MMQLCVPRVDVNRGSVADSAFNEPPKAVAALQGHLVIDFDRLDTWYLEDDLGYAHPRDPYHRFDVHRSSQRVVVRAGDIVIAESSRPALLFETSMAPRFYFPPDAVRTDLLEGAKPSPSAPIRATVSTGTSRAPASGSPMRVGA